MVMMCVSPAIWAQGGAEDEGAADDQVVDETATEGAAVEQEVEPEAIENVILGNYMSVQAGLVYTLLADPHTRVSLGYDFTLNEDYMLGANIGFFNAQNFSDDDDAVAGESSAVYAGFKLKALRGRFFLSNAYNYIALTDGYTVEEETIDDETYNVYEPLTSADISDAIEVSVGMGYNATVGRNLLIIPEVTVNYSLPTGRPISLDASDLSFALLVGIGFNPAAVEPENNNGE